MKVEISENHGGAAVTAWCAGAKVEHKEAKLGADGKPIHEVDLMVTLLEAAVAAVGTIPKAEEAPEGGESKAQQQEREANNAKALADWQTQRAETEAEEEEAMLKAAAEAQAASAPPPPPPQEEPQPQPS